MTRMLRNIISFGKIAYSSKRKINEVEIDIRLCEEEEGEVLSISANVWNSSKTDIFMGGQCLKDLFPYFKNNTNFKIIFSLWSLYHCNDMHAGTQEQEEALKNSGRKFKGYTEECEYLKEVGLYEVPLNGETYKYGHKWLYQPIPPQHLADIHMLLDL